MGLDVSSMHREALRLNGGVLATYDSGSNEFYILVREGHRTFGEINDLADVIQTVDFVREDFPIVENGKMFTIADTGQVLRVENTIERNTYRQVVVVTDVSGIQRITTSGARRITSTGAIRVVRG